MKEELINATLSAVEKGIKELSFSDEELGFLQSKIHRILNMIEAKKNEVKNV